MIISGEYSKITGVFLQRLFFTVNNDSTLISKEELEKKLNNKNIYDYNINFILRPIELFTNKNLNDVNEFKVLEDCVIEIYYTFINGIFGNTVKNPYIFNLHLKKDEIFKLEDIKNSLPENMTSFKINRVI